MEQQVNAQVTAAGAAVKPWLRRLGAAPAARVALTVLLGLLWAAACYAVLDLSQHGSLALLYERSVRRTPGVSLLGVLVVWVVLVLVWAVLGRALAAGAVAAVATAAIAFANRTKLDLRIEPVLPSDVGYLAQPGFLAEMVGLDLTLVRLAAAGLGLLVVAVAARRVHRARTRGRHGTAGSHRAGSRPAGSRRAGRRGNPSLRWTAAALSLSFLGYLGHFHEPGNGIRRVYDEAGADWAAWSQEANYRRNGFVAGTLYNLHIEAMARPPGYSEAAMRDIVARWTRAADRLNRYRSPGALDDVNVVLVLSESFADPTRLGGVRVEEDPIPFTREVMAETTSGTLLVQKFGGGTANMEFEVLTGMSLSQYSPQMTTPYQMLVPERPGFPSVVRLLEADGHASVAVHAYSSHMYRREAVYPALGFDDFVSLGELQSERTLEHSTKVSDDAAFDETLYQLERSERPLLVNLVTMQNHFPMRDLYESPLRVRGVHGGAAAQAGGYARGLAYSDRALERFLARLKTSSEPTAVIFYGDHQAPFWPERIRRQTGDIGLRSTPYFLWANFGLQRQPREDLTSPVHLLPMLYDAADAPLPPYYVLLDRLHDLVPAMSPGTYFPRGAGPVPESGLAAEAARVLRDYRLVQYDLSVGHGYATDGLFGVPLTQSAACSHDSCP